jgi:hypothetical protein
MGGEEWFWTIVSFTVILGIGGVVGLVMLYWLIILPKQVVPDRGRSR